MKTIILAVGAALVLAGSGGPIRTGTASSSQELLPADLDRLLAPIALYPDQLLAQMLMCATDPAGLKALDAFLKSNSTLKGTELQDAAVKAKLEPSFVALALFPQVVQQMLARPAETAELGRAFKTNRPLVFESIQRLRTQAQNAGTLKTTPQQEVETQTTPSGQQVIVIEPANPQVVYVPQYNPQVVYTQPTTVVVQRELQHGCRRRRTDRFHGGDRDRRGDRQQLLLRPLRVARRGLHVQRRLGRLLRPP